MVKTVVSTADLERLRSLDAAEQAGWSAIDRIRERNSGTDPGAVSRDVIAEVDAVRQAARRAARRTAPQAKRTRRAKPA